MSRWDTQNHIVLFRIDAGPDGDGLLASTHVDTPDDLPLPVQFPFDSVFKLSGELHVVKQIRERLRAGHAGGRLYIFYRRLGPHGFHSNTLCSSKKSVEVCTGR